MEIKTENIKKGLLKHMKMYDDEIDDNTRDKHEKSQSFQLHIFLTNKLPKRKVS